ncbi:hypothetical protein Tco_1467058 [Tanacetum coccineum]
MKKKKSEKGLIAESFDCDEESISSEDEGTTKIRAFMSIAEDEPSVGKADARSRQWVDITMKKTCSKVTLNQLLSEKIPSNNVKALGGRGKRKEKLSSKEVIFIKADESSSMPFSEITSDSESNYETQVPLPPLPKLIGAAPVAIPDKNADSSIEQLLLTLIEEVKGLKKQIEIPSGTTSSNS